MPLPNSIDAPYNFVPLADWVYLPDHEWARRVSHDLPFREGLSGHLDLSITAHTPILVGRDRRPGEVPNADHPGQVHPFQLPDGRYALPGTALKGMLRNVVEIASFSRMAMVDDQRLGVRDLTPGARQIYGNRMTETVGDKTYRARSKAGWLSFDATRGGWMINPCEYARVEHSDLLRYQGARWVDMRSRPTAEQKYSAWARSLTIRFTPGPEQGHPHSRGNSFVYCKAGDLGKGTTDGVLVFTGQPSPRKHQEFIFYNPTGAAIPVPEPVFRGFLDIHDQKTENAPRSHWDEWRDAPRAPVFYLEEPGRPRRVASLGLALMYKLAYDHSIHDAIRHASKWHLDGQDLDLATLLFGRVGDTPASCLKGRVTFQHAVAQGDPHARTDLQPTILNGPKPTYYPNYIRQPRAQNNRIPDNQGYSTLMDPRCQIRGWKRYPARPPGQARPQPLTAEQQDNPSVQTILYPLPAGTRFVSRLTFHNLLPVELGAICWALTWGNDGEFRHGLGMGKPFGFGQISIEIDQADLRLNRQDGVAPRWEACTDEFIEHMDQAHRRDRPGGGAWRDSYEIRSLLAMADPDLQPAAGSKLHHMSLTTEDQNDFKDAKTARMILADYPKTDHPPLWGEREAERKLEEERVLQEIAEREAAERRKAEEAKAQAEFDAKPAEERLIIEIQREIDAFLTLDESQCRDKQRRQALQTHLNRLADQATGWPDRALRTQAADLLETTYENAKVGWTDPGLDKKKRQKQEKKRRQKVADIRTETVVKGTASGND
jgi:CRISPR-associated protein (TIGR03986 family)